MSDYTQTQDNRQQQYKRYDFVLAGAIKMRKAIYEDRFIWLVAIITMYFCYPIIRDITLTIIGGK